ncbi:MAG: hypothetical protein HUK15_01085, partial [Bacteroidales bacterium]|nr:hypothetical protein [Bacteroidales bacterium]
MKKKNNIPTLNQDFDLEAFLTVLKKNVFIIVILFVLAVAAGYLYYRYTAPLYSSSAVIQIKNENKTNELLGLKTSVKIAPTIEVMRSSEFLKTVVKVLPLDVCFFNEGAFLTNEIFGNNPFEIKYEITNSNIYKSKIYYERNSDDSSYELTVGDAKYNAKYNVPIELPEGVILTISEPIESNYVENTSIKNKFYFQFFNEEQILKDISSNLDVSIMNDEAGSIQIIYQCHNAKKAAEVTNAIAEQFMEFDVLKSREGSLATIAYIDEQMDIMVEELSQIESQLQQFRIRNGITNEDIKNRQNNLLESKFSRLEQRLVDFALIFCSGEIAAA